MQPLLSTSQRNVLRPWPKFVTVATLELLPVTNTPLPVVTLHRPVPAVPADNWATVLQVSKSFPALTTKLLFTNVTWLAALQPFLLTVHVNTLFPPLRLLTELVQSVGVETTEVPPLTLQTPIPWVGS